MFVHSLFILQFVNVSKYDGHLQKLYKIQHGTCDYIVKICTTNPFVIDAQSLSFFNNKLNVFNNNLVFNGINCKRDFLQENKSIIVLPIFPITIAFLLKYSLLLSSQSIPFLYPYHTD